MHSLALSLGSMLIQSSDSNYKPLLYANGFFLTHSYSVSLPSFVRDRTEASHTWVLLSEAQIGTGAAAFMAVRVLLDHGVPEDHILLVTLVASAQGGLWSLQHAFPKVRVIAGGIDPGLERSVQRRVEPESSSSEDDHEATTHERERVVFAITPGCGQIGDRFWGT